MRRLRADSQPAPGRLRASFTPVLRPVREMQSLDWDRKGRVTPAWTASQEARPGAEPRGQSPGESRSGAPEGERASVNSPHPRPAHWQAATSAGVARTLVGCASRRSAPLFLAHDLVRKPDTTFRDHAMREANQELCCCGGWQTSGAERVARRNFYFVIASEAKQSRLWAAKVWIASSLSLLAMTRAPMPRARGARYGM